MSSPNPFADKPLASPSDSPQGEPMDTVSVYETYNMVSDTVGGVNFRKSDNWFQAKVILVCMLLGVLLGAVAGALFAELKDRLAMVLVGGLGLGFGGVVAGLFGSGIYLMIYRAARHLKGKHD